MRIKILDYNNARRQLSCALHLRVFSFWSFPLKQLNLIPMIRKLSYQYVRGLSSTCIMCSGVYTRNITITLESHFSKYLMINISGNTDLINYIIFYQIYTHRIWLILSHGWCWKRCVSIPTKPIPLLRLRYVKVYTHTHKIK